MKSASIRRRAGFAFLTLASAASTAPMLALGAPAAGTEVTVPVQSELMVYVPLMTGKLTTPLATAVPLPVSDPFPSATTRFTCS